MLYYIRRGWFASLTETHIDLYTRTADDLPTVVAEDSMLQISWLITS